MTSTEKEACRQRAVEALSRYFERRDTPAANSPVGQIMQRIAVKRPELNWEENRALANELQRDAARREKYIAPRVRSFAEIAEQKERLRQWKARKELPIAA